MQSVAEIKAAIDQLTAHERAELMAALQNWPQDEWDQQMAKDAAPGGKLCVLKETAEAEARSGALRPFPSPTGHEV